MIEEIAWDRAVNGTVKQLYYHGELVGEARVYSDRLLSQILSASRAALQSVESDPAITAPASKMTATPSGRIATTAG